MLGSEGSCWQCVAAAAQEVTSAHLSASPRGARMTPFTLSTKAFCFAIWRRVSFPDVAPVILEITHSHDSELVCRWASGKHDLPSEVTALLAPFIRPSVSLNTESLNKRYYKVNFKNLFPCFV